MKNRIKWIDLAKFIGITFVIYSHFEACPEFMRIFFSPFFLAIFFFVSGYTFKVNSDFKSFLVNKINQLIIPWLIYSNINILISGVKSFKQHDNSLIVEIIQNLYQIRYYGDRLWFVPALFTASIAMYFVIKKYEIKPNNGLLILFVYVLGFIRKLYKVYIDPDLFPWHYTTLPWHLDYIPTALTFMVLGYLFRKDYEKKFDQYNCYRNLFIITIVFIFVVSFENRSFNYVFDYFYDQFCHILGLLMIVSFSKLIKGNKMMLYIGMNTLIYFFIHNKCVTLFEVIFKNLLPQTYEVILTNQLLAAIYCAFFTLLTLLILLIPTHIINKYLYWTVGKKEATY